ncbi:hypothetical protein O9993_15720 [Vibrio lentus]|nr:hypothetical protein [Vibrio lentus]
MALLNWQSSCNAAMLTCITTWTKWPRRPKLVGLRAVLGEMVIKFPVVDAGRTI